MLSIPTPRAENGEIVLAVDDAEGGRLAEPLRGHRIFRLAVDAFGVKHCKVVHGLGIALVRRGEIEAARLLDVLFQAHALFIHAAEAELGRRDAAPRRAIEPGRGHCEVLGHPFALGKT